MVGVGVVERVAEDVRRGSPTFWRNPHVMDTPATDPLNEAVRAGEDRLRRARGLFGAVFPSLQKDPDPIRSPLVDAQPLGRVLIGADAGLGRWLIKADDRLPIAGSIKARGGFHEVIAFAERVALEAGALEADADLAVLARPAFRSLFADYSVVVGSTGNLGMGIGLIAAALGFKATVHMSSDAKDWKKTRLREHGVSVVEHRGDYAQAVAQGRQAAKQDPFAHFVDDESSLDLFVGYAAAAKELAAQLRATDIVVDGDHPLFIYLPCGVGGAPGGVTYGLKRLFGPHVHCLFAEPVQSPCMLVQLMADSAEPVSVYDLGLSNRTEADGLAVAQASLLVAPLMRDRVDAIFTVTDDQLFGLLGASLRSLDLSVEPSAAAAFAGPVFLTTTAGRSYLEAAHLLERRANATHVLWTTGGSLIPPLERDRLHRRAHAAGDFKLGL